MIEIPTLGNYIQRKMDEHHMSANSLAFAAGVAQSTISTLLKQGEDKDIPGAHPLVLRTVCDVLRLDYLYVFQLAGYIPMEYEPPKLATVELVLQQEFRSLTRSQRQIVLDLILLMREASDFDLSSERVLDLLNRIRLLQRSHPMFRKRRFTRNDEIGRISSILLRIKTPEFLLKVVHEKLERLFKGHPGITMTPEYIDTVINHAYAKVILNILLPRKDVPSPVEKLYWLILPPGKLEDDELSKQEADGIRALWRLLDDVTQ